ncbi:iron ABC transporter permease [Candidatus Ruthia endofausta]|uniref:Iron ABC transporter permease n=1 Tax=Candidatus Ruthia endofausta TaxID=2738852 RepID=A0A6N0HPG6_9GAMM|nr:iron ABC transporter permease [Candidatus Ruthia endofausta]QKQ24213.1 iron ABC transporter permease [Candidatus Ruthia endofausta]
MEKNCLKSKIWVSVLALLVAMPIFVVALSWLFTERELWAHFSTVLLPNLISATMVLLIGVGLGVTLLGTILAYLVVMVEFPGRRWLEWALFLPFAIPAYVLAFVYLGVFDYSGYVQVWMREVLGLPGFDIRTGPWAIILTFVLGFYPYVYMMVRASFKCQKINIIEAGQLLGASPLRVFLKISLPMARPAAAAGLLVTLMETLADFGVVSLFNFDTFTTAIYSAWGDFRSIEVAAQLASLLVLVAFFLIFFEKKARGQAKYYSNEMSNKKPYYVLGFVGWLISLFVFCVFMLSFAMPVLQLIIWGWGSMGEEWSVKYVDLIISTSVLTTSAALITVSIATILALPSRCKRNSPWLKGLISMATLGYALPGSIMAVGLLYGINQVSVISVYFGGQSINHIIFGSIALLLFAYVSRFMAIGYSSIKASAEQIKPVFIQNARLLGASCLRLIWQIYLPMMTPGILAGGLLVAVDVMKELPATYLLRPFGWDTLAVQVYELSAEGLFERAAIPALIMVLFGAVLMLIFQLLDQKSSKNL